MTEELHLSQHFRTSRERLFRAFVDPVELAVWFAPQGFHVLPESVTVQPHVGGRWGLTMASDADPDLQSVVDATIVEFEENALLVGSEEVHDFPGLADGTEVTLRLKFADDEAGTALTVTQGPFPADLVQQAAAGWAGSLTNLDHFVSPPS